MSQTVVHLGQVPINRGQYTAKDAKYYKDNIVQYNGSAFIAHPTAENAAGNSGTEQDPIYYITVAPYDVDPTQLNPGWETFASDAAYVNSFMFFTENPEWVYVVCDSEDKILFGVKQDGEFYFGAGCPPQVKSYIEEKISALSLDEYEAIVAFLDGLIGSDTTLKMMLDSLEENKVDKEEGKSLIDAEYASTKTTTDNPEFLEVTVDSEDKVLEGIQADGTKVIGGDLNIGGSASINGDAKILGNMELSGVSYKVIENPEYLAAWVDASDKVIFGLKADGKTYVGDADFLNEIKNNQEAISEINATIASISSTIESLDIDALTSITTVENPEFIEAKTDSEGKLLAGRTPDGAAFENIGFATPKVSIDGHVIENIEDPEGRIEATLDGESKIISYRDEEGVIHENVGISTNSLQLTDEGMTDFQKALRDSGFSPGGGGNWSDYSYIYIPNKPTCAIVNITGVNSLPAAKGTNSHAWMEVWDKNGNYFKKKVILDLQGRSSQAQYKKNFSADFCEDEWIGDDTTTIKIGNWVSQDSFHFKAYYTDLFKMANMMAYSLWDNFKDTMSVVENRPYKEYYANSYNPTTGDIDDFTQNTKDEAKCVPDGFPVCVYLNGDFYGLFVWQLKKHRDNYMLDRNGTDNIHLDGEDYVNMFNGTIRWNLLEIRNPKPKKSKWTLTCMDGSKYDGDNPKELIDSTATGIWDPNNTSHVKSAKTKENIIALSNYMSEIAPFETAYNSASPEDKPAALATLREEIEKRFGIKWLIDYVILINLEKNSDTFVQNVQWVTWGKKNGKVKWYPCPYDHDNSFGIESTTSFRFLEPSYEEYGKNSTTPIKYIYSYYLQDMKDRWHMLRDLKIIDEDKFMFMLKDWIDRIGNDNLELEYKKWDQSPCNRKSEINPKWQMIDAYITFWDYPSTWSNTTNYQKYSKVKYGHRCFESLKANNIGNTPSLSEDTEWWKDVTIKPGTYQAGDEIWDGYSNFFKFKALEDVVVTEDSSYAERIFDNLVNAPFSKLYSQYPHESGVFDSIYRIYKWIKEQISIMDTEFEYNN